jgi:hypothetical protein
MKLQLQRFQKGSEMRRTLLRLRSDSAEIAKGWNSIDFSDRHSREHNTTMTEMANVAEVLEGVLQGTDRVAMALRGLKTLLTSELHLEVAASK